MAWIELKNRDGSFSPFLPLLLLAWTLVTLAGLQTYGLLSERDQLATALVNQATPMEEAQKIRAQLQSLATGAADLAVQGNENAQRLIDELARQGVTVNPSSTAP
ncbi:MAG: hypothetical protein QNJ73_10255 [Gammaproteobacteria bacterium]|nr:hypothetical protein [Gammaproteobacteria bacterium]